MPADASRQRLLCVYDAHARAFAGQCGADVEDGEGMARSDLTALWSLAEAVVTAVVAWGQGLEILDLAISARFDHATAAIHVAETVFDEVLTAPAYGAFRAALDVVLAGEYSPHRV